MDYTKQNFTDGQVLTAACLNKIEEGLSEFCQTCENLDLPGKAADAKAVGDRFSSVSGKLTEIDGNLTTVNSEIAAVNSEIDGIKTTLTGKRVTATATISATWTGSAAPYIQDVSVSGILSTDTPHITPVYSSTFETAVKQKEAWSMVDYAQAGNGIITFVCFADKPATAIPIQIEVNR